jgi:hypothetical protein
MFCSGCSGPRRSELRVSVLEESGLPAAAKLSVAVSDGSAQWANGSGELVFSATTMPSSLTVRCMAMNAHIGEETGLFGEHVIGEWSCFFLATSLLSSLARFAYPQYPN